jgi:hypothetical protein
MRKPPAHLRTLGDADLCERLSKAETATVRSKPRGRPRYSRAEGAEIRRLDKYARRAIEAGDLTLAQYRLLGPGPRMSLTRGCGWDAESRATFPNEWAQWDAQVLENHRHATDAGRGPSPDSRDGRAARRRSQARTGTRRDSYGKEPAGHSGDGELQEGAGRDASRDRAEGATTYCGWKETAT